MKNDYVGDNTKSTQPKRTSGIDTLANAALTPVCISALCMMSSDHDTPLWFAGLLGFAVGYTVEALAVHTTRIIKALITGERA